MKRYIITTIFSLIFFVYSSAQQLNVGHLVYNVCCEVGDFEFQLKYNNQIEYCKLSTFSKFNVINVLTKTVQKDSIIEVIVSVEPTKIQIWFAYTGSYPSDKADFWLLTDHHSFAGSVVNGWLAVPSFTGDKFSNLKPLCENLARKYPLKSFMFRISPSNSIPFSVLSYGVRDGNLADMRNVPYSYRLVPYFKDLNWKIIWYMDEYGTAKGIIKPNTGWK